MYWTFLKLKFVLKADYFQYALLQVTARLFVLRGSPKLLEITPNYMIQDMFEAIK